MVGTALISTLLLTTVTLGVGLLMARPVSRRIFGTEDYAAAVQLAMLSLGLLQMTMIAFELSRTLGEARRYFGFSVIQLAVQISASVGLIVGLGWNLEGVLFANVLASAAVFLASGAFLWRHCRLRLSRRHLARLTAFGLAMMPGASASWITGVSDRFFLQHYAGAATVGVYALGYKFANLIEVGLILPFQKAWNPFFFALQDERHARQLLSRMFTYYVGWLALGVAALSLAGGPLVQLMAGARYRDAAAVIPVVAVGYLFVGLTSLLGTGLIVANRIRVVAAISAIGAAVNLILNVMLIPAYGMMGAAYATTLSFVLAAAVAGLAVRRWYRVDLEVRRLLIITATVTLLVLVGLQVHATAPFWELATRAALFAVVPVVAWGTGFLTDPEMKQIGHAWRTCRSYLRSA